MTFHIYIYIYIYILNVSVILRFIFFFKCINNTFTVKLKTYIYSVEIHGERKLTRNKKKNISVRQKIFAITDRRSLVGLVAVDAEFSRKDYGLIHHLYDQENAETTKKITTKFSACSNPPTINFCVNC
jgi:hypothetical protein